MKRILITVVILIFVFAVPVSADVYSEQLELSGAQEIDNALPDDTERLLSDLGLTLEDSDWINKIKSQAQGIVREVII